MEFVYPMVSILLRAEFGSHDQGQDALHFICTSSNGQKDTDHIVSLFGQGADK